MEGLGAERRDVEKHRVIEDGDAHVMEDAPLRIQIEGLGGQTRRGIVEFLGEQGVQPFQAIRAGHAQHATVGTIHERGGVGDRPLFDQGRAVMPRDARPPTGIPLRDGDRPGNVMDDRTELIEGHGSHGNATGGE